MNDARSSTKVSRVMGASRSSFRLGHAPRQLRAIARKWAAKAGIWRSPGPAVPDAAVDKDHRLAPALLDEGELVPLIVAVCTTVCSMSLPQLATAHSATAGSS